MDITGTPNKNVDTNELWMVLKYLVHVDGKCYLR